MYDKLYENEKHEGNEVNHLSNIQQKNNNLKGNENYKQLCEV